LLGVAIAAGLVGCGQVTTTTTDVDAEDQQTPVSLTVQLSGEGTGRVVSAPAGVDCGADCSEAFAAGTSVTLSATPLDGSSFGGWSGGGCSGTAACTVTLNAATTVSARFDCGTGSATFDFTGAPQVLTRPACVTRLTVDVRGAAGGVGFYTAAIGAGGPGGGVAATVDIGRTDTITIFVGGAGGNAPSTVAGGTAGYNGGAAGGGNGSGGQSGGGGGGASDIRLNGTELANRIVIAGGGGGVGTACGIGYTGGAGGGLIGETPPFLECGAADRLATGGTQNAGGIGGLYPGYCTGGSGSLGLGGAGCSPSGGGGGGGGYYGGGGGSWMAGGGGSSYTDASVTGVTHRQGVQSGHGQVVISW
jgi:hypothetical protein